MIRIDVDYSELERARKLLSGIPKGFSRLKKKVETDALKAVSQSAADESAKVYYIKKSRVKKAVTRQNTAIIIRGKRQNVTDYKVSPMRTGRTRNGIKVGVMRSGGLKPIARGFLLHGRASGKLIGVERLGRGKSNYKTLVSPAIPQLMENDEVQTAVTERVNRAVMESLRLWSVRILAGG